MSSRTMAFWLVLIVLGLLGYQIVTLARRIDKEIDYTDFLTQVHAGLVKEVVIRGHEVQGVTRDNGSIFRTFVPDDPSMIDLLKTKSVIIKVKPEERENWFSGLLLSWLPILFVVGLWFFFMRQVQIGGGKAMSFGKSRARLIADTQKKVTFSDVAGIDEAKTELEEIIQFLKDPKKFTRLGGRIPKGVLLVGSPGTGKTLLARAIAGEAGVPFFSISGSDFVEMFVGVGASRVRDLFQQGKKNAPCIIFIDEIDAVGRHRGAGLGGGHDEREQTLNQLLVEMDGFESNDGVILISATNRPDVLDPALLRPGRFDRRVVVARPDLKGRLAILKVHSRNKPLSPSLDLEKIARGTPGFSGADLENLVNEAALTAAQHNKAAIELEDFEKSKDKVMMGVERRSMIISDVEKKNTAYHEAGHALVAKLLPNADPVYKVTIIPRGMALGATQQLPMDDRYTYTQDYLEDTITTLLGGRSAEEVALGHVTTGAGNDLERATDVARKMVTQWGMSRKVGPLTYGLRDQEVFLGRDFLRQKEYSEQTAMEIDAEVRRIVGEGYERAKALLAENLEKLHALAKALLEKEVIDSEELETIVHGVAAAVAPAAVDGGGAVTVVAKSSV
ncbi:MAG: ATP-dependent metallopeptidase FtsH/Yme1/Tma family protein [Nitrospirae bacterium]|nr:ATP-dependent metallopeptidase FtsH/Yme1/Tma family protein [Nitrospirota bacterium]